MTSITAQQFRSVLGHYPTGVCVVTSVSDAGVPVGLAVGSFTSVSLDPPLVAFLPDRRSASWQHIRAAGRFCVNVLSDRQEALSRLFGGRVENKFDGLTYRSSPSGLPVLEGVVAWIDCGLHAVHEAGDHDIAVGLVHALEAASAETPLVFHRGGYGQLVALPAAV